MQDNVCDSGTCKCGSATACTAGTKLGSCLDATGMSTIGDTAATCKVMENHFIVLTKMY